MAPIGVHFVCGRRIVIIPYYSIMYAVYRAFVSFHCYEYVLLILHTIELRIASKAREKELLQRKRNVAMVTTNAGGFEYLAASLGSDSKAVDSSIGVGRYGHTQTTDRGLLAQLR